MKFDILTIFPEYFDSPFSIGLFKKAREKGVLEISTRDIRDYTEDKHRTVDDSPYGGGGGMLQDSDTTKKRTTKASNTDTVSASAYSLKIKSK